PQRVGVPGRGGDAGHGRVRLVGRIGQVDHGDRAVAEVGQLRCGRGELQRRHRPGAADGGEVVGHRRRGEVPQGHRVAGGGGGERAPVGGERDRVLEGHAGGGRDGGNPVRGRRVSQVPQHDGPGVGDSHRGAAGCVGDGPCHARAGDGGDLDRFGRVGQRRHGDRGGGGGEEGLAAGGEGDRRSAGEVR